MKTLRLALAATVLSALAGCAGMGGADAAATKCSAKTIALSVRSAKGTHAFCVETAKTSAEQERGLMFRTDLTPNGGMLFAPYPPEGGAPREASFWMKNTPSALDIVFIRANGTIARIAENAIPFDETPLTSGEPVGAILEVKGGRTHQLGIVAGDTVSWSGHGL